MKIYNEHELEDLEKVELIFNDIRKVLEPYFKEKGFIFSNNHLFVLMLHLPLVLGTIADGQIEPAEAVSLQLASKSVHVKKIFEEQKVPISFELLKNSKNGLSDQEFEKMLGDELEFIAEGFSWYEDMFIQALSKFSELDKLVSYKHMKLVQNMSDLMVEVCEENMGDDKVESVKLEEFFTRLGWLDD